MTLKPYPTIAQGPIVTCPCCRRDLEITAYDYDGDPAWLEDMDLHATAAPLREQPCDVPAKQFIWRRSDAGQRRWFRWYPSAYDPGPGKVGYVRAVAVGRAVCSWLGPACNVASHVTPVTLEWYARRGRCTLVADVAADRAVAGLARCVHLP